MRKLVIGLALASTALTSPAVARDGAWYIGADGGVSIIEDNDFTVNGIDNGVILHTDVGYDFGGYVGYDFGPFRLETEVSYREADVNRAEATSRITTTTGGFATGSFREPLVAGDINVLSFMLNGMVDFGDDDGLQAFFGGGVGVARTDVQASVNNVGGPFVDDSDTGFAWQALAGVRAPLSDSWDVGLKYRFFNADSIDLIDSQGRSFDGRVRSHSLLGSIVYNFGGDEAPPPPPPHAVSKSGVRSNRIFVIVPLLLTTARIIQ